MEIDYAVIGKRIRRFRRLNKLTQEQLAERVEVSPVYIRYIENAKRTARLDTYVRIANALGCTMDELLAGFQASEKQGRYPDELAGLLEDCDAKEIGQITAMVAQLKQVLRTK